MALTGRDGQGGTTRILGDDRVVAEASAGCGSKLPRVAPEPWRPASSQGLANPVGAEVYLETGLNVYRLPLPEPPCLPSPGDAHKASKTRIPDASELHEAKLASLGSRTTDSSSPQ